MSVDDHKAFELLEYLANAYAELGPVLSWEKREAIVTLADDMSDAQRAASEAASVVERAMIVTGLDSRAVRVLEVERVPASV